jgi:hypothetical protein
MRKFPEECSPVIETIERFRAGVLDASKDKSLIDAATEIVRRYNDNTTLCSPSTSTDIEVGDFVTFRYSRPDVNEPWRFGVVTKFLTGTWTIYTFNLKHQKGVKEGSKPTKCGPGYRNYTLSEMGQIRIVAGKPPAKPINQELARDLETITEAGKRVFGKLFGGKEKS